MYNNDVTPTSGVHKDDNAIASISSNFHKLVILAPGGIHSPTIIIIIIIIIDAHYFAYGKEKLPEWMCISPCLPIRLHIGWSREVCARVWLAGIRRECRQEHGALPLPQLPFCRPLRPLPPGRLASEDQHASGAARLPLQRYGRRPLLWSSVSDSPYFRFPQSLLIISQVTRRAATWPLVLELKLFLSNNMRMSKATEMCLRDHNSNNYTRRGNVCYCTYMVNNDYDTFRSFSRLYMTLFRHRTCTYLHGGADRFLV